MKSASKRREPELGEQPADTADHGRSDDEQEKLQQVQPQHVAVPCAEAFHHGDRVQAPRDEAPRRDRDGHAAEQHAHECREHEEPLGVADRGTNLRPAVAVVADLIAGPQLLGKPCSELRDRALAAREQRVVLRDAACSEQSCRVDVVEIQQHGRRDLDEPPALVGSELEGLRDPKMQGADVDLVADGRVETREQARLRPDLTALRSAARAVPGFSCVLLSSPGASSARAARTPMSSLISAANCTSRCQARGGCSNICRRARNTRNGRRGRPISASTSRTPSRG